MGGGHLKRKMNISSADNVVADAESRISSTETEWEITPKFFSKIRNKFGPFDIDLFTTHFLKNCASQS